MKSQDKPSPLSCYSGGMKNSYTSRGIIGVLIIIFGILSLLGALEVFNFGDVLTRWWPIFLIIGGLLVFANNRRQFIWGPLLVIIGVLLQLRQLEIINFNIWQLFWPAIIIGVGVSILINRSGRRPKSDEKGSSVISAILSGSDTKSHASDYKGGSLTAALGGITLDLREAKLKGNTATLNVFVLMGGIELTVPKEWNIQSNITPILGGVDSRRLETPKANAPTLILTGDVVLGGVEIKH